MKFDVEYTDTFGGEANYTWTQRAVIEAPDGASQRMLVGRAKKAMGLTGVTGKTTDFGDMIRFCPHYSATAMFITPALEE